MEKEKYIKVESLTKSFGKVKAVNGLSFFVNKGDIFGFLGHNGAGKSTTLKILLSLIKPESGLAEIFGYPITSHRNEILQKTGAMVDEPAFYGYLSALQNLEMLDLVSGKKSGKKKLMEILELVGLEKRFNSKVNTFSHGMKQRLGLAQALINDPELLLLDEPTNGLDPEANIEIRNLILQLNRDLGKTILLSSHQLNEVELIANRMVIINQGKEVVEGDVKTLLKTNELKVQFETNNALKAFELVNSHYPEIEAEIIGTKTMSLQISKNQIHTINQLLVSKGILVYAIEVKKSLEDYYLKLVHSKNQIN